MLALQPWMSLKQLWIYSTLHLTSGQCVWPGLTSGQVDAKLLLFEDSNVDINWGNKFGWIVDLILSVWSFALFFLFSWFDFGVSDIPLTFFFSLLKPSSETPEEKWYRILDHVIILISNVTFKNEISSKALMWFKFYLGKCIPFFERLVFWPWKKSEKYLKTGKFWRQLCQDHRIF